MLFLPSGDPLGPKGEQYGTIVPKTNMNVCMSSSYDADRSPSVIASTSCTASNVGSVWVMTPTAGGTQ